MGPAPGNTLGCCQLLSMALVPPWIDVEHLYPYTRWRPYQVECTGFLSASEIKRLRARLVLGWGTAWEHLRVLSAFAHGPGTAMDLCWAPIPLYSLKAPNPLQCQGAFIRRHFMWHICDSSVAKSTFLIRKLAESVEFINFCLTFGIVL